MQRGRIEGFGGVSIEFAVIKVELPALVSV